MTNATMVTCSDLNVATYLTMCTFSVRSVACGIIGSASLPIVVTLGGNFVQFLSISCAYIPSIKF